MTTNTMFWDQDPTLPDSVNDCIDLLLLVFSWPPIYRTEVRRTIAGWSPSEVDDCAAFAAKCHGIASDNSGKMPEEPEHLFDLRTRCAVIHKREMPQRMGMPA